MGTPRAALASAASLACAAAAVLLVAACGREPRAPAQGAMRTKLDTITVELRRTPLERRLDGVI